MTWDISTSSSCTLRDAPAGTPGAKAPVLRRSCAAPGRFSPGPASVVFRPGVAPCRIAAFPAPRRQVALLAPSPSQHRELDSRSFQPCLRLYPGFWPSLGGSFQAPISVAVSPVLFALLVFRCHRSSVAEETAPIRPTPLLAAHLRRPRLLSTTLISRSIVRLQGKHAASDSVVTMPQSVITMLESVITMSRIL